MLSTETGEPKSSEIVFFFFFNFFLMWAIFKVFIEFVTVFFLYYVLGRGGLDFPGGPVVKTLPSNAGV